MEAQDVSALLRAAGVNPTEGALAQCQRLGALDFDGFRALYEQLHFSEEAAFGPIDGADAGQLTTRAAMVRALRTYDQHGSGLVSLQELRQGKRARVPWHQRD